MYQTEEEREVIEQTTLKEGIMPGRLFASNANHNPLLLSSMSVAFLANALVR